MSVKRNAEKLKSSIEPTQSVVDRFAIGLSGILGSLWFFTLTIIIILFYLLLNWQLVPGINAFDKPPLNNLDTALSIFAIITILAVLIGQNRQNKLAKIKDQLEFEINIRAENEITKMLIMLHAIQQKLGIDENDEELESMKKELDIDEMHSNIQNQQD